MPLGADFRTLTGPGAGTLFPEAGEPSKTTQDDMHGYQELIQTKEQFNAAVRYGVFNGSAAVEESRRFAIYRAEQIESVYQVRDNTRMRTPPPAAVYYPWRIYVGHSYTMVVQGEASTFTAEVGLQFLRLGGKASAEMAKYQLSMEPHLRGFKPRKGDALFSLQPEDVGKNYTTTGAEPVPIVVEYRQIEGATPDNAPIAWTQSTGVQIRFTNLTVGSEGGVWEKKSWWNLSFECLINGKRSDAPVTGPPTAMQVERGKTYPLMFSQTIVAVDSDDIECTAGGQYTHGVTATKLAQATTGRLRAADIGSPKSGILTGKDANTSWSIAWTASKVTK